MSKARDLANLLSSGVFADGVISTTEISGVTSTATELNKLDGVTASTTELNKLTGLTSTTAELNKLTGLTTDTAELNKLDGVTASTVEINKLAGLTASTAELNNVAGINSSVQTQLDSKAPTANPTFTGTATVPTLSIGGVSVSGIGTSADQLVKLDSSGNLPAINGSALTGIQGFSYASTLAFGDY